MTRSRIPAPRTTPESRWQWAVAFAWVIVVGSLAVVVWECVGGGP